MPKAKITLGADPELFVKRKRNKVAPFCAHGLVPGDKREPFKVKNGAVQVDGMALEFNIDATTSPRTFSKSIQHVMDQLIEMVPKELEPMDQSVVMFSPRSYDKAPPESKVLGCEPDRIAYSYMKEHVVNPPKQYERVRGAGGHIHIGWTEDADIHDIAHIDSCALVAAIMGMFLGILEPLKVPDKRRSLTYGRAGAFRPKPYGVEYRTLSNWWIFKHEYRTMVAYLSRVIVGILMKNCWRRRYILDEYNNRPHLFMNIINRQMSPKMDMYQVILRIMDNANFPITAVRTWEAIVQEYFNEK